MAKSERRELLSKPQIERLKALSSGLHVAHVLGDRVLVKVITPKTKMDELEAAGLIVFDQATKEANTPKASVGVVMKLGEEVSEANRERLRPGVGVMFSPYAGSDWALEHEDFRVLDTREVLCTLEADDNFILAPVVED